MSDPRTPLEPGLRARTPRPSLWAREASVFIWLLLMATLVLGLLLFWL